MEISFGNSATDTWRMDITYSEREINETATVLWEIRETDGRHIHEFSASATDRGNVDSGSFICDWDPVSGDFILSVADEYSDDSISGNFITSGGTFRFSIDYSFESPYLKNERSFEISTSRDVNIPDISFVNIADITVESLEGTPFYEEMQRSARRSAALEDAWMLADALNMYNVRMSEKAFTNENPPIPVNGRIELIVNDTDSSREKADYSITFESQERALEVLGWITSYNSNSTWNYWTVDYAAISAEF
jgi:hypothetical protein